MVTYQPTVSILVFTGFLVRISLQYAWGKPLSINANIHTLKRKITFKELSCCGSGFRANHSTDTCLSQLTDMVLNDAENK